MATWVRTGSREFTLEAIDRLTKFISSEVRNSEKEIDSRIARVAGQYLLEQPDGIFEPKFRLFQNAQALKGLKAIRSKRQSLSVNAFRSCVVSRLFFAARLVEQDFQGALRLCCPGCCRNE